MIKVEAMESLPKTENSNSNSGSLQTSTTDDTDQSVLQRNDLPKEANRSCSTLPKLLFAEWLSLDYDNGIGKSSFPNSTDPALFKDAIGESENFQDAFFDGLLTNERSFGSEFYNGMSNSGSADDDQIFSSQLFKLESEISGSGFHEFHYGDEICSGFNMNNDVMYM